MTATPPPFHRTNAGRAARRSSSPGPGGDPPEPAGGATHVAARIPGGSAGRSAVVEPARRRRLRPGSLRTFLALSSVLAVAFDAAGVLRRARRGPWRAEVAEGSMAPALLPGDWLLLDPTVRRWPRPGSIVVVREPTTGILAIKRVAARGRRAGRGRRDGEPVGSTAIVQLPDGSVLRLAPREAWVVGDAPEGSIDSRTYGPLDADDLVARAWFRYGPPRRVGRLR